MSISFVPSRTEGVNHKSNPKSRPYSGHCDKLWPVAAGPRPWQSIRVTRDEILHRLELVRLEHRDLDHAIAALAEVAIPDQLQQARLKKRKLRLRDEIAWMEDKLIPDIIA